MEIPYGDNPSESCPLVVGMPSFERLLLGTINVGCGSRNQRLPRSGSSTSRLVLTFDLKYMVQYQGHKA